MPKRLISIRKEGKTVQTVQMITPDVLEMTALQIQLMKSLIEAAKELTDKLNEARLSTIRPDFYTTEQMAELTGFKAGTLRKYHSEGAVGDRTPMPPSVKLGGKTMYPHEGYEEWKAYMRSQWFYGRRGKEVWKETAA
jgi:hypothetical protein